MVTRRRVAALVLIGVTLALACAPAVGAEDPPDQNLDALLMDIADLAEGAKLVRETVVTARDMSPSDNSAAEVNRALYVAGKGWVYEIDETQILVLLVEARTHQAATAFAKAQGTGRSDVAPNSFRGLRRQGTRVDVNYAGSVGRLMVFTGVVLVDPSSAQQSRANGLAQRIYLAQRERLPSLADLSDDKAKAVGRHFGHVWGAGTFLVVVLGVLVGASLSFGTDRGSREWRRGHQTAPAPLPHQHDVTAEVRPVQRVARGLPVARGVTLATVAGLAIAAPGLRAWQSIVVVLVFMLVWALVETWLRSRRSRWDLARGSGPIVVTTLGSTAGMLVLVAGVLMMTSAVAGVASGHPLATPVIVVAMVVLGLEIISWSRLPARFATRLLQPMVREQINNDPRPPLLFLRSFQDDSLDVRPPVVLTGAIDTFSGEATVRFEEVIAWTAWETGPLRTFGQPGTRLQPLGAARDYHGDVDWQDAIRELAEHAQAYVLVAGRSPSLMWEIAEIRARRRLARTVFVFAPVDDHETGRRIAVLCQALDLDTPVLAVDPTRHLLALGFDITGVPTVYTAAGRTSDAYVIALREALRNVSLNDTAGEPAPWARKHHDGASPDLATFDPDSVRKHRSVISKISDIVLSFVPI